MSGCSFCAKVRRWLGAEALPDCDALWLARWEEANAWERAQAGHDTLWWNDPEPACALIEKMDDLGGADPEAALALLHEAAEEGSAWAMHAVGSYYETGTIVAADADRALDYYHRAICAGSWMATIDYARLLADQGHVEDSEAVLQDGVRLEFVPAYFWLAWLRYERAPTRATCREIRPLLDHAAEQDHPGAQLILARFMAKGKFGLRQIPRGFRRLLEIMPPPWTGPGDAPAQDGRSPALKPATR